ESDNKNAPLSLNLSEDDQQILTDAGNNPNLMYAPSGTVSEYDVNKILYRIIESPSGNYYEFSADASQTLYTVAFTYFGQNLGDYQLKQTVNNGRVFEYVGPGLGDYHAVRELTAPQKKQVFSVNAEYLIRYGNVGTYISFIDIVVILD